MGYPVELRQYCYRKRFDRLSVTAEFFLAIGPNDKRFVSPSLSRTLGKVQVQMSSSNSKSLFTKYFVLTINSPIEKRPLR